MNVSTPLWNYRVCYTHIEGTISQGVEEFFVNAELSKLSSLLHLCASQNRYFFCLFFQVIAMHYTSRASMGH